MIQLEGFFGKRVRKDDSCELVDCPCLALCMSTQKEKGDFGSLTWANEPPSEPERYKFLQERNLFRSIKKNDFGECERIIRDHGDIVDLNVEFSGRSTPLHIAAAYASKDIVNFLLDHEAEIEAVNSLGMTPLMNAAACGQLECAQTLIERGADTTATNMASHRAAEIAKDNGYDDLCALLS